MQSKCPSDGKRQSSNFLDHPVFVNPINEVAESCVDPWNRKGASTKAEFNSAFQARSLPRVDAAAVFSSEE